MLSLLGVGHAAVLVTATLLGLRPTTLDRITKLNVLIVVGWVNLVLTGILLSFGSALGQPWAYTGVSVALAVVFAGMLSRSGLTRLQSPEPLPSFIDCKPGLARVLLGIFLLTGVAVLIGNFILAAAYLPTNPDSVSYRLPRIYWYRDAGSLAHFASGIDPRAIFYPFNGTLLQLPIPLYHGSIRLFTFVSLAAWCVVALTVFRIARDLGASTAVAIGTAWLVALTPCVLAQATSTNDEIIAAVVLLIGVQFLIRFERGRAATDLGVALLAIGLSIGTKLHSGFYWPFAIVIAPYLVARWIAARSLVRWPTRHRAALAVGIVTISTVLAVAFVVPNWRASGHFMETDLASLVLNKPFRWGVGLQNLALHTAQTALSPVPDLHPASHPGTRQALYDRYNATFADLFGWVKQGPEYMSASYRFRGVTQTYSPSLTENTVAVGFVYLIALVAFAIAWRRRRWIGIALGSAFIAWFATYGLMTRYIEGFPTYLAFAFIVSSPLLVFYWLKAGPTSNAVRLALLLVVVGTHLVLAFSLLRSNVVRNLREALAAAQWPVNPPLVDHAVMDAIRRAGGVRFLASHWEIPYWLLMAPYSEGKYRVASPHEPRPDELNLYAFQQATEAKTVPIRIPGKRSTGLTLLGSFWPPSGPEWAFATGGGVHVGRETQSGYIVLQLSTPTSHAQAAAETLDVAPTVWGLTAEDALEFRYRIRGPDGRETISDWSSDPSRRLAKPADPTGAVLIVEVGHRGETAAPAMTEYPLDGSGAFELPPTGRP